MGGSAAPSLQSLLLPLLLLLATTITSIESLTNHTVGGTTGWFFLDEVKISASDYTKWADSQTFSLGDFLIFNTNSNQTVIQTYNQTTYKSCDSKDASDTDTFVYSAGDQVKNALTFAVPLTIEGLNYFFSDAEDGVQCPRGMAFHILVKHGSGLPPSLNQPPPPPYVEPPTSSHTAQDTPSSSSSSSSSSSPVPSNQQETFHNAAAALISLLRKMRATKVTGEKIRPMNCKFRQDIEVGGSFHGGLEDSINIII